MEREFRLSMKHWIDFSKALRQERVFDRLPEFSRHNSAPYSSFFFFFFSRGLSDSTVWLFLLKTFDDDITWKVVEIIIFWKKKWKILKKHLMIWNSKDFLTNIGSSHLTISCKAHLAKNDCFSCFEINCFSLDCSYF